MPLFKRERPLPGVGVYAVMAGLPLIHRALAYAVFHAHYLAAAVLAACGLEPGYLQPDRRIRGQ